MNQAANQEPAPQRAKRVLAIASHPIQYQAPWFRALAQAEGLDFSVLFVQLPNAQQQGAGFGVAFEWDTPLLQGYRWQVALDVRGPGGLSGFFSARLHRPVALLRQLKPDALLLTGWHVWPLLQMLMAARRLGVPVIMRGESNGLRQRPWAARLLHRLVLGACKAFLPIGTANRNFYRAYGVQESAMFDAPYFVDNAHFAQAAQQWQGRRGELRERWRIASDAVCFCFAGKLEPKKRVLDLLDALRQAVAQTRIKLHLLIVGSGDQQQQAQDFVRQHALPVTFTGFLNQSEIPSAYAAVDCLVLPSDFGETWGLVVNEAMACGRPAIVSDRVGCGPDLVTPGVTGLVFPFGDTSALAARMLDMANHPDQMQRMGQTARERVWQGFSVDRSVAGTLQAVRHVCPGA